MRRILFSWFIKTAVAAIVCGLVFVTVQQVYRQNADDPQVEVTEEIANALNLGSDPSSISQQAQVELSRSLLPVVLVFDKDGKVTATNAVLDGQAPTFPKGSLEASNESGENRVTWEPREGVRVATVIRPYKSEAAEGYVLVGRSLREVEKRINRMMVHVGLAFLALELLIIISIALPMSYRMAMRKKAAAAAAMPPTKPIDPVAPAKEPKKEEPIN